MSTNGDYQEIISLVAELSAYRKGTVSVFIDLERGYLTWRESNRWCNNFTRTVTREQIQLFREQLEACRVLSWRNLHNQLPVSAEGAEEPQKPFFNWNLSIQLSDRCFKRSGENRLPGRWPDFRTAIEYITRTNFDI